MKLKFIIAIGLVLALGLTKSANAQGCTEMVPITKGMYKYGKTPEDSIYNITQLSLYRESIKNYKRSKGKMIEYLIDAIKPWRKVFYCAPKASQNIYIDGVLITEYLISQAKTEEAKEKAIDTLFLVYKRRIEAYGREGYVKERWAIDYLKYRPTDAEEIHKMFTEAFEIQKNESSSAALYYQFKSAENMVKHKKADTALIIETFVDVSEVAEFNIKKYKEKGDKKNEASYTKTLQSLENDFSKYANCKDIVRVFTPKFEKAPTDVELGKKIVKILDKNDCIETELFYITLELVHSKEPSAKTAMLMGKLSNSKEMHEKAVEYFDQAISMFTEEDIEEKYYCYILRATALQGQKKYSEARSSAQKAAELKPDAAMPYIIIGGLYLETAGSCVDRELLPAYWAAYDKYAKAKNMEPDNEKIVQQATQQMGVCRSRFPKDEKLFMHNLKDGDSYTVGCWINEPTTVRKR
jgi:tetratricopeptide (TPR) repeat protein